MSELTPGDPAYDRYSALIASLHDMPISDAEEGQLTRLVAWTAPEEIRTLVQIIGRAQEHAARARVADWQSVLAQVVAQLDGAERNDSGDYLITVSARLATRLLNLVQPD